MIMLAITKLHVVADISRMSYLSFRVYNGFSKAAYNNTISCD